jgi:hypothetical protein
VEAGSGPERDDFGLPPVDIEIPDDARELDEDVQAYRREQRAIRRQQRANRLRRPLTLRGRGRGRGLGAERITLPLLACSLMLALIISTLLVMFAADQTGMPQGSLTRSAATGHPSAGTQGAAAQAGRPLPAATVIVGGRRQPLRELTASRPSVLALVPRDCGCASKVRQVAAGASAAHVSLYLVGTPKTASPAQLEQLAAQAGLRPAQVVTNTDSVLAADYGQDGLTAVLVRAGGTVTYIGRDLQQGLGAMNAELGQLALPGTGR